MRENTLRKEDVSPQVWRDAASQTLQKNNPTHPVLQRLKRSMISKGETGMAITSYDRMHHRHNRG